MALAAMAMAVLSACGDDGGNAVETEAGTDTQSETAGSMGSAETSDGTSESSTSSTASTTTTSATTEATSTTTDPDPGAFDDEFDDPATLSNWTRLHEVEGDPAPYSSLDIDGTNAGQLTIIPNAGGWFDDYDGTFLFKPMSGDFVVEVSVTASQQGAPSSPPDMLYNSAGLMVRDPASGDGSENWVIHNVGRQSMQIGVATEGKTTQNSNSSLQLTPGTFSGRLRLCRVGSRFLLARQLSDESSWTQTNAYDRTDMPNDVQLGMMVNGWNSNGGQPDLDLDPDVVATFDYIRMWRPESGEDSCTAP
jgi:regulation of enolase protein 1 (concanavalin A-like superfamily)